MLPIFLSIEQSGHEPALILGRIKPVDRSLSETPIIKADCTNVHLGEAKIVPRLFHFGDRSDKLTFTICAQAFAERPDVDSRAFGIVVRRDIDFDSSGIIDSLAIDHIGAAEKNEDKKSGKIALHFELKSRKLNHRFGGCKWQTIPPKSRRQVYSLGNLVERTLVTSIWRKHLIICLFLGLLAVPIYFLDLAFAGGGGGGNWITLDFRGIIFWTYITLLAIHVILSSIAVLLFRKPGVLRIHLGSMVLSVIVLAAGVVVYGKLRRLAVSNQQRALMESRRPLINVVELKQWWYVPDESDPTEIRVSVVVHQSGRFAGNVTGEQMDPSSSSTTVFESTNGSESQRWVSSGQAFTYAFPLKVLHVAHAADVRITLYLFKARSGPAPGDIAKVFMNSPQRDDDGEYFYGVLPAPSRLPK